MPWPAPSPGWVGTTSFLFHRVLQHCPAAVAPSVCGRNHHGRPSFSRQQSGAT